MPTERDHSAEQTSPIFEEADRLIDEQIKLSNLSSAARVIYTERYETVYDEIASLIDSIPQIKTPENETELLLAELEINLRGRKKGLECWLEGRQPTIDEAIIISGLSSFEVDSLEPWLTSNKPLVEESVRKLYDLTPIDDPRTPVPFDMPNIRQQAIDFATPEFETRYEAIVKMYKEISPTMGSLLETIRVEPTTRNSFHHNKLRNLVGLDVTGSYILFLRGGKFGISTCECNFGINEATLLEVVGHECCAHAQQELIAKITELPKPLGVKTLANVAGVEAIAHHHEEQVLKDVEKCPETLERMGIQDQFPTMARVQRLQRIIQRYKNKYLIYALVLGGQNPLSLHSQDGFQRFVKQLEPFGLYPVHKLEVALEVEKEAYPIQLQGGIAHESLTKLSYISTTVSDDVLKIFEEQGIFYDIPRDRDLVDRTIHYGYFSPQGLRDKARLAATGAWVPPEITQG